MPHQCAGVEQLLRVKQCHWSTAHACLTLPSSPKALDPLLVTNKQQQPLADPFAVLCASRGLKT